MILILKWYDQEILATRKTLLTTFTCALDIIFQVPERDRGWCRESNGLELQIPHVKSHSLCQRKLQSCFTMENKLRRMQTTPLLGAILSGSGEWSERRNQMGSLKR